MMNRRDLLKAGAAAALGALVPSWLAPHRRRIDLSAFCARPGEFHRYDLTAPFVQAGEQYRRYATNGRICVAEPAEPPAPDVTPQLRLPPAAGLPWKHDMLRGWRPWPRVDYLTAAESDCPDCHGEAECEACEGEGCAWPDDDRLDARHPDEFVCRACDGRGFRLSGCQTCGGTGLYTGPSIQTVGGVYVARQYDQLVRRHLGEVEFAVAPCGGAIPDKAWPAVFFRYDGGAGIMLGLAPEAARQRIEAARRG